MNLSRLSWIVASFVLILLVAGAYFLALRPSADQLVTEGESLACTIDEAQANIPPKPQSYHTWLASSFSVTPSIIREGTEFTATHVTAPGEAVWVGRYWPQVRPGGSSAVSIAPNVRRVTTELVDSTESTEETSRNRAVTSWAGKELPYNGQGSSSGLLPGGSSYSATFRALEGRPAWQPVYSWQSTFWGTGRSVDYVYVIPTPLSEVEPALELEIPSPDRPYMFLDKRDRYFTVWTSPNQPGETTLWVDGARVTDGQGVETYKQKSGERRVAQWRVYPQDERTKFDLFATLNSDCGGTATAEASQAVGYQRLVNVQSWDHVVFGDLSSDPARVLIRAWEADELLVGEDIHIDVTAYLKDGTTTPVDDLLFLTLPRGVGTPGAHFTAQISGDGPHIELTLQERYNHQVNPNEIDRIVVTAALDTGESTEKTLYSNFVQLPPPLTNLILDDVATLRDRIGDVQLLARDTVLSLDDVAGDAWFVPVVSQSDLQAGTVTLHSDDLTTDGVQITIRSEPLVVEARADNGVLGYSLPLLPPGYHSISLQGFGINEPPVLTFGLFVLASDASVDETPETAEATPVSDIPAPVLSPTPLEELSSRLGSAISVTISGNSESLSLDSPVTLELSSMEQLASLNIEGKNGSSESEFVVLLRDGTNLARSDRVRVSEAGAWSWQPPTLDPGTYQLNFAHPDDESVLVQAALLNVLRPADQPPTTEEVVTALIEATAPPETSTSPYTESHTTLMQTIGVPNLVTSDGNVYSTVEQLKQDELVGAQLVGESGQAGQAVQVTIEAANTTEEVTIADDGTWAYSLPELPQSEVSIALQRVGAPFDEPPVTFFKFGVLASDVPLTSEELADQPAPVLDHVALGAISVGRHVTTFPTELTPSYDLDEELILSGAGVPASVFDLSIGGTLVARNVVVDDDGAWSVGATIPAALALGPQTIASTTEDETRDLGALITVAADEQTDEEEEEDEDDEANLAVGERHLTEREQRQIIGKAVGSLSLGTASLSLESTTLTALTLTEIEIAQTVMTGSNGTPGEVVEVTVASTPVRTQALAAADGAWSVSLPTVPLGSHTVSVKSAQTSMKAIPVASLTIVAAERIATSPDPSSSTASSGIEVPGDTRPVVQPTIAPKPSGALPPPTSLVMRDSEGQSGDQVIEVAPAGTLTLTLTGVPAGETVTVSVSDAGGQTTTTSLETTEPDQIVAVEVPKRSQPGPATVTVSQVDWTADLEFPVTVAGTQDQQPISENQRLWLVLIILLVGGVSLWLIRRMTSHTDQSLT